MSSGQISHTKLSELITKQKLLLNQALQLPRLQAVVYCTWSTLNGENESVVSACVDEVNSYQHTKTPFNLSPPGMPLSAADIVSASAPLVGKALRFQPSSRNCGCFATTISREADDPKEAAKGILKRAADRGIMFGAANK